jgi:deoxyribodipyrimidine photo-lyase
LGKDYSSKFSVYLSLGCLSPRIIYEEIKKAEAIRGANDSTYWLIFELLWRDYYYFIALKFGIRLFKRAGIKHDFAKRWKRNRDHFKKWMDGETGVPFIDANMRELKLTGYLSNRGRQNVASFFTKDLGLEWWWGAMYFESQLIDYEVCSNWGNWNYLAGIGTDPREDRYFSPVSQAKKYDANAEYIKYWIPELQNIDSEAILEINELKMVLNDSINYTSQIIPKNKKW